MRILALVLLLNSFSAIGMAQTAPPKREMRAVWVVTLANLDWPSSAGLSVYRQQQEFIHLLNRMQIMGMNAIMVQVRPAGDAFYPSKLVPWSQYLAGKQGKAPVPYYDPLAFMVQECHARNIEFHAWFNPFRALSNVRFSTIAASNPLNHHSDWFYQYGNSKYFDPGQPQARDYITQVIMEVVRNYDIDGVHLDDYFYPYPLAGQAIPDEASYRRYASHAQTKAAWRRQNVDNFIATLSDSIYLEKQWVKFGVSPFGVWRNAAQDTRGSDTHRALSAYDELYADARKWLDLGWVDYLAPQLYWGINGQRASYSTLLEWWSKQAPKRHIYIGHGIHKMQNAVVPSWATASEFMAQVDLCRKNRGASGDIWFRASTLLSNSGGFSHQLRQRRYNTPAMVPTMPWLDSIPPNRPRNFSCQYTDEAVVLSWRQPTPASDLEVANYYVVYRFEAGQEYNLEDPTHILSLRKEKYYVDTEIEIGKNYVYVVTAVDRMHNESPRYVHQRVRAVKTATHLEKP